MVNFKASGHQGEHKRALASQGSAQPKDGVSKLEKNRLLARPWSDADPLKREVVNKHGIALQVVAREKLVMPESTAFVKCALVDQETYNHLCASSAALGCSAPGIHVSRPGGDFVLAAQVHEAAEPGSLLLGEAQRLSLHV